MPNEPNFPPWPYRKRGSRQTNEPKPTHRPGGMFAAAMESRTSCALVPSAERERKDIGMERHVGAKDEVMPALVPQLPCWDAGSVRVLTGWVERIQPMERNDYRAWR